MEKVLYQIWLDEVGKSQYLYDIIKKLNPDHYVDAMRDIGSAMENMLRDIYNKNNVSQKILNKKEARQDLSWYIHNIQKVMHYDHEKNDIVNHLHKIRSLRNEAVHTRQICMQDAQTGLYSLLIFMSSAFISHYFPEEHQIASTLIEEHKKSKYLPGNECYTSNVNFERVNRIMQHLENVVEKELRINEKVFINNIALDLGVTWPEIEMTYLSGNKYSNLDFRIIIIDPDVDYPGNISLKQQWQDNASININHIKRYLKDNEADLKRRNIRLYIKKNQHIPYIHGFEINRTHLYWSFCGTSMENGQRVLKGGGDYYSYHQFSENNPAVISRFEVFNDWFDCWWEDAKDV